MRIVIETVDHAKQRYDTVGDWQAPERGVSVDGYMVPCDLLIRVSRMNNWQSEALVAVHELVEALLCEQAGVTQEQVDAWDLPRASGAGFPFDEPGEDPMAPYHKQHMCADVIERALAAFLGVSWAEHEARVNAAGCSCCHGSTREMIDHGNGDVRDEPCSVCQPPEQRTAQVMTAGDACVTVGAAMAAVRAGKPNPLGPAPYGVHEYTDGAGLMPIPKDE